MELEKIYKAIKRWKILIDSYKEGNPEIETKILSYLNQGTHFLIEGREIQEWQKNLEKETHKAVHAYVGIDDDNQLKFFLIDSKSDSISNFSNIVVKDFNRRLFGEILQSPTSSITPSIDFESAINRNFKWNMFGYKWLRDQKAKPLFQLIEIPFDDFENLNLEELKSCISFFGLTNEVTNTTETDNYHIEIITVKTLTMDEISKKAENYSTPRPPFSIFPIENYQLLKKSDANP